MPVLTEQEIRLNLGGRGTKIPGFKTVDLSDEHDVDVRADVAYLPFKDGSVSEIYASHILEHFSHTRTLAVLKEWVRVLKKGGTLYVSVPDFDRAIELYRLGGLTDYLTNLLWGDQGYPLAYHYAPFTAGRLLALLHKAGFSDARRIFEMPYGLKDCSHLVDTVQKKPISLNMEARK